MTDKTIIISTCSNAKEAERLASLLVGQRLAACVNVLPGVTSIYRWKGAVEQAKEHLLLIKTTRRLAPESIKAIRQAHSYEVPEALAIPIVDGLDEYLRWIDAETGPAQE